MNLRSFALFLLIPPFLFSCNPGQTEQQQLKDKVIAVHDEVMPKIGNLKSVQKDLLEKAKELEKRQTADSDQIEALHSTVNDCEEAYNNMFVWMRQYQSDYGEMTDEEIRDYLNNQLLKVEKVNQDIKSALDQADSLLSVNY
ncbi:MAG: hypothetical protein WD398_12515 [Cyclobacteriaceae bacterium]